MKNKDKCYFWLELRDQDININVLKIKTDALINSALLLVATEV